MKILAIFLLFFIASSYGYPIARIKREESGSQETSNIDASTEVDEDDPCDPENPLSERARTLIESFPAPISLSRTTLILNRAIKLLNDPKSKPSHNCQRLFIDRSARSLLRFLMGDNVPVGESSQSSSQQTSQQSSQPSSGYRAEPECDRDVEDRGPLFNGIRRVSLQSIENIVRMADEGQSERSIKGKYRWYSQCQKDCNCYQLNCLESDLRPAVYLPCGTCR